MLIYILSSCLILLNNSSCNLKKDTLRLAFAFVVYSAFVGSVAHSDSVGTSGVGSRVGNLCNFLLEIMFF